MKRPRALGKPDPPVTEGPRSSRHFRARDARSLVTERHVQQTVTELLEWDGWRSFRTEHAIERNADGGFRRKVGEPAMPDYLYIRYGLVGGINVVECPDACAEVLWVEYKKPGEEPTKAQLEWHEQERARGGLVVVIDSIEGGKAWYKTSGLQRR